MAFPLSKTIQLGVTGPPTVDRFGNEKPGTLTWQNVSVFGWATDQVSETTDGGNSVLRTIDDMHLYAPPGVVKPEHQVKINGVVYSVEGNEKNFDGNPWYAPGLVIIALRKVTG